MSEPYAAADGLVRVYPATTPADAATEHASPALVWAHGGGFVAGDLDMPEADWVARSLAARGVTVVSVDYRLAGDGCRYPAPSDDVLAAWHWTVDHAHALGLDPDRIAIGGASAGGNLAAGAVLRLLADGETLPTGVLLAYPTLLAEQPTPDAELHALLDANPDADRFGPEAVRWMYVQYLDGVVDDAPVFAVPGLAEASDLAGFPPVLMINDEADELRVSGELFASMLAEAGASVDVVVEPGTQHGHLNRPDEPAASASIERIVHWIAWLETHHRTTLRITEGTPS